MTETKWTPGPWTAKRAGNGDYGILGGGGLPAECFFEIREADEGAFDECEANAHLIAAAPELYEALALHAAWAGSEESGPDYHGMTRDTHPDGEAIWRKWWDANLDLCARADEATKRALAKARGES